MDDVHDQTQRREVETRWQHLAFLHSTSQVPSEFQWCLFRCPLPFPIDARLRKYEVQAVPCGLLCTRQIVRDLLNGYISGAGRREVSSRNVSSSLLARRILGLWISCCCRHHPILRSMAYWPNLNKRSDQQTNPSLWSITKVYIKSSLFQSWLLITELGDCASFFELDLLSMNGMLGSPSFSMACVTPSITGFPLNYNGQSACEISLGRFRMKRSAQSKVLIIIEPWVYYNIRTRSKEEKHNLRQTSSGGRQLRRYHYRARTFPVALLCWIRFHCSNPRTHEDGQSQDHVRYV